MSLHRGIVVDVADPAELGRWSVEVPGVIAQPQWGLPVIPLGFSDIALPEIGTEVWVAFEADDFSSPVILGTIPRTDQ